MRDVIVPLVVRVAVAETAGSSEPVCSDTVLAVSAEASSSLSCLGRRPGAWVAGFALPVLSLPLDKLAVEAGVGDSVLAWVELSPGCVSPSSTGQKLHVDRLTSQYKSISNLRKPLASRLEKHFAAAADA